MTKSRGIFFMVVMVCCHSSAHARYDARDTNLTCAAYYYTLSIFAPEYVKDLTVNQAVKASFAFRNQVDGVMYSDSSDSEFMKKWAELDGEVLRPATPEHMSTFRSKYENTCKSLLQKAWCDAYKDYSEAACVNGR